MFYSLFLENQISYKVICLDKLYFITKKKTKGSNKTHLNFFFHIKQKQLTHVGHVVDFVQDFNVAVYGDAER